MEERRPGIAQATAILHRKRSDHAARRQGWVKKASLEILCRRSVNLGPAGAVSPEHLTKEGWQLLLGSSAPIRILDQLPMRSSGGRHGIVS
jgi:hypothetical protein